MREVTVVLGDRSYPVLGESANRVPQHVDLRTEVKSERGKPRVLHVPYIAQDCGCGEGGTITSPTMRGWRPGAIRSTQRSTSRADEGFLTAALRRCAMRSAAIHQCSQGSPPNVR